MTQVGEAPPPALGMLVLQMTGTVARLVSAATLVLSIANPARAGDDRTSQMYHLCTACHGPNGAGDQLVGAPAIAGLPEWYIQAQLDKFHNGGRGAQARDLGGMRMRPMARGLEDADRKALAKYVSALPRPNLPDTVKGSLIRGDSKFQLCTACHGAKGEGNQQVGAPPLAGGSDWYYVTQLRNFKNKVRGYDATLDPLGVAMQGISTTLDDEGISDLVAYINALKPAN